MNIWQIFTYSGSVVRQKLNHNLREEVSVLQEEKMEWMQVTWLEMDPDPTGVDSNKLPRLNNNNNN